MMVVFSPVLCQNKNFYDLLGDFSDSVHLFPFRTEKLSLSAQMILG